MSQRRHHLGPTPRLRLAQLGVFTNLDAPDH
jgi:hypothetical protein